MTLGEIGRPPMNYDDLRWSKDEQWRTKIERKNNRKQNDRNKETKDSKNTKRH